MRQNSQLHTHRFYKLRLSGQSDHWVFQEVPPVNSDKRSPEQGNKSYWLSKYGLTSIKVFTLIEEIVNRTGRCDGLFAETARVHYICTQHEQILNAEATGIF